MTATLSSSRLAQLIGEVPLEAESLHSLIFSLRFFAQLGILDEQNINYIQQTVNAKKETKEALIIVTRYAVNQILSEIPQSLVSQLRQQSEFFKQIGPDGRLWSDKVKVIEQLIPLLITLRRIDQLREGDQFRVGMKNPNLYVSLIDTQEKPEEVLQSLIVLENFILKQHMQSVFSVEHMKELLELSKNKPDIFDFVLLNASIRRMNDEDYRSMMRLIKANEPLDLAKIKEPEPAPVVRQEPVYAVTAEQQWQIIRIPGPSSHMPRTIVNITAMDGTKVAIESPASGWLEIKTKDSANYFNLPDLSFDREIMVIGSIILVGESFYILKDQNSLQSVPLQEIIRTVPQDQAKVLEKGPYRLLAKEEHLVFSHNTGDIILPMKQVQENLQNHPSQGPLVNALMSNEEEIALRGKIKIFNDIKYDARQVILALRGIRYKLKKFDTMYGNIESPFSWQWLVYFSKEPYGRFPSYHVDQNDIIQNIMRDVSKELSLKMKRPFYNKDIFQVSYRGFDTPFNSPGALRKLANKIDGNLLQKEKQILYKVGLPSRDQVINLDAAMTAALRPKDFIQPRVYADDVINSRFSLKVGQSYKMWLGEDEKPYYQRNFTVTQVRKGKGNELEARLLFQIKGGRHSMVKWVKEGDDFEASDGTSFSVEKINQDRIIVDIAEGRTSHDPWGDKTAVFTRKGWVTEADKAAVANITEPKRGGIDLNTSSGMQWKVSKDGTGVEMNMDPIMIEKFKREGIDSLTPVIFKITPIASIWPLVGLKEPAKQTQIAHI